MNRSGFPPIEPEDPAADDSDTDLVRANGSNLEEPFEEQCDEALEYVTRLIERMNEGKGIAAATSPSTMDRAPAARFPIVAARPEPLQATASQGVVKVVAPVQMPQDTADIPAKTGSLETRPPRRPSHVLVDLVELREAANLTTNHVLREADCRTLFLRCYRFLALAVFSMAISIALVSLSTGLLSLAYMAAVVTMAIGAWSTWQCLRTADFLSARVKVSGPAALSSAVRSD